MNDRTGFQYTHPHHFARRGMVSSTEVQVKPCKRRWLRWIHGLREQRVNMYVYPTMNACPYTSNPHLNQQSVRMDLSILLKQNTVSSQDC